MHSVFEHFHSKVICGFTRFLQGTQPKLKKYLKWKDEITYISNHIYFSLGKSGQ